MRWYIVKLMSSCGDFFHSSWSIVSVLISRGDERRSLPAKIVVTQR